MARFDLTPRSPYANQAPDNDLMTDLADIQTVAVSRNQRIGYTLLNRARYGQAPPLVAVGGFMSDLTMADRAYEGACLASLGRPVLMLDLPGHGLSSPHNRDQVRDLCWHRRVDQQAAPLTDAVQALLDPNDQIDHFGISHGGLLALKMAEQDPGDRVASVFGVDIPAVKKRWTVGLQLGYLIVDGLLGRHRYLKELEASPHGDDWAEFQVAFDQLKVEPAANFRRNNPGLFAWNLLMSVDARPATLEAWSRVMDDTSATVTVVTAERSTVSDYQAIQQFIDTLNHEQQARSQQLVAFGEDHNIGITHLIPRLIDWLRQTHDD